MLVIPESLPVMACVMLAVPELDQFVGADLGDGAQDALLLLDAVTYDDDIIDLLSLFDKRYGQGFPPPYRADLPGFVTQERDLQRRTLGNRQLEIPLRVGHRAC